MNQCHHCGATLSDNTKFCGSCGANLEVSEKADTSIQELSFYKGKMLGTVTYKRTTTSVKILSDQIDIQQTIKKIFCREKNVELTIPLNSVKSARVRTALDFWDTLYAIIFATLGLFQPALFLMAALCFWCGYGKEIEIALSNGGSFKIPVAGSKNEIYALLTICNNR